MAPVSVHAAFDKVFQYVYHSPLSKLFISVFVLWGGGGELFCYAINSPFSTGNFVLSLLHRTIIPEVTFSVKGLLFHQSTSHSIHGVSEFFSLLGI